MRRLKFNDLLASLAEQNVLSCAWSYIWVGRFCHVAAHIFFNIWATSWENLPYATNKGTDQLCSWAGRFESYLVEYYKDRFSCEVAHLSWSMTKPTKWCAPCEDSDQPRHLPSEDRSAWVRNPTLLQADSEDRSDWANAQAYLSLCWAHKSFCWFCHAPAHLCFSLDNTTNGP